MTDPKFKIGSIVRVFQNHPVPDYVYYGVTSIKGIIAQHGYQADYYYTLDPTSWELSIYSQRELHESYLEEVPPLVAIALAAS